MTTVFQQAIQLIAVALAFAFLEDFAAIAAFEPSEDLVWKLLMAIAFMYLAGRVPSMLGITAPSTPGCTPSTSGCRCPAR